MIRFTVFWRQFCDIILVVVLACAPVALAGPDPTPPPIAATVTLLAQRPHDYAGKFVSVRSRVILGRGPLIMTDGDYRILISEPGSNEVRDAPFRLVQDGNWHKLNEAVAPVPPPGSNSTVIAVIEGRFDSKAASWLRRLFHLQLPGYGHVGLYDHRIVIHRVASVEIVPTT